MYTGHFSVALAGSGRAPRIPLWLLIGAAFACDFTEAGVAAIGVRDPMRVWSHSLPAAVAAGVVVAALWRSLGGSWREAGIVVLVAASHVPLDFVTAVKSFWPGLPPMGLDLYHQPWADAGIEAAMCLAGWLVWRASLAPAARRGMISWAMLAVLLGAEGLALVSLLLGGVAADLDALSKFVR